MKAFFKPNLLKIILFLLLLAVSYLSLTSGFAFLLGFLSTVVLLLIYTLDLITFGYAGRYIDFKIVEWILLVLDVIILYGITCALVERKITMKIVQSLTRFITKGFVELFKNR